MNAAQCLLDLANNLRRSNGIVLVEDVPSNTAAVAALALNLLSKPGLALRAQVEEWNKVQIVRESY